MPFYKQLKKYGSMVVMIIINIMIFFTLFVSLLHYNSQYRQSIMNKNKEDIQHIVNSTSLALTAIINERNAKIQDIRYYAQHNTLDLESLLVYILSSSSMASHNLQLIGTDSKGFNIDLTTKKLKYISYETESFNLKSIFKDPNESYTSYLQYTPEFINPYTGKRSIALYTKFKIAEESESNIYTLMTLVSTEDMKELLEFQSSFDELSIILCDNYGNYIIDYDNFGNKNFFTYISANNHMSEIERFNLHNEVYSTRQGQLIYKDNRYNDVLYTYNRFSDNSWFTIGAVRLAKLYEGIDSSNLALHITAILFLILGADITWMLIIKKRLEESITTQKQQNAIIEAALQEAQSASMAKSAFLNNISHDIKTPINAVIEFTSLAQNSIEDKWQTKDYLDKIMTSSSHLMNIITEVLDLSRIENGKVLVTETRTNLNVLLSSIFKIMQPGLKEKRLNFQLETSSLTHVDVLCDRTKLDQILLNILSNAIKFTPQGGIVTLIAAENKSHKYGYGSYEFTVKDRGIGISSDFLPHVFEPFEKERTEDTSSSTGAGLGMAITKSYVDMMNGTISVVSKKNTGTTVTVKLKLRLIDNP